MDLLQQLSNLRDSVGGEIRLVLAGSSIVIEWDEYRVDKSKRRHARLQVSKEEIESCYGGFAMMLERMADLIDGTEPKITLRDAVALSKP